MYGWPWERGSPAAGRHKSCRGVSGPAEARQRQKMKEFREEMKANEARQRQEMREFREEMKEIRGELAEIKADNRVINEKLDRLTEDAMAVR